VLKVGIIGVGFGGQVHLPAWRGLPAVEVVAVADSGSGAAAKLDGDHVAYGNWRDLLAREDIDVIDVATPPATQRDIVLAALARKRHVLCEKPFGAGLHDAAAMATAQSDDRVAAVGYQFRFEPAFQALRQCFQAGAVGDLLRVDVRWMTGGRADPTRPWGFQHDEVAGGGVGNAFLSHVVDYLLWMTASRLDVDGGARLVIVGARADASGAPRRVTAEDSADLLAHLDGSVPVTVAVSNCLPGGAGHRVEVYGTKGRLSLWHLPPFGRGDVELLLHTGGTVQKQAIEGTADEGDSRIAAVRKLFAAFRGRIDGADAPDLPTFEAGLAVQRVLRGWRAVSPLRRLRDGAAPTE
jgi:predicted dehydrogenase